MHVIDGMHVIVYLRYEMTKIEESDGVSLDFTYFKSFKINFM